MKAAAAGLDGLDLVHHVSAGHHLAEHRIAPALGRWRGVVQKAVVGHVDEKLCRGRVRVAGAGHGHGVVGVLEAVVGFVLDGRIRVLLLHAGLKTAALHHETGDHTMEDRVVVVALVYIRQEVLDRLGRLVGVEFEGDDAVVGDVQFDLGVAHGMFLKKK